MLFQYIGKSKKKFHNGKEHQMGKRPVKTIQDNVSDLYKKKCHNILEVFVLSPYDKHSVSSYLSSLLLPLIPKKGKKTSCYDCVTYIGGCHGDHPPCCQATCDWPCQPLIGRGLLKVPKMLSKKKKKKKKSQKKTTHWWSFIAASFRLQIAPAVILILIYVFPDLFMHL